VHVAGSTRTGIAYAVVLKYSSNVRAPFSRFGFPTISGRTPSPPPAKLIEGEVPMLTPRGRPLMKLVKFWICQPSKAVSMNLPEISLLNRGTSHRKWRRTTFGRS
jgi:hypothetical protein